MDVNVFVWKVRQIWITTESLVSLGWLRMATEHPDTEYRPDGENVIVCGAGVGIAFAALGTGSCPQLGHCSLPVDDSR